MVALVVFLTLVGTGVANASWTAPQLTARASATAGTIGISQTGFDQLAFQYTSSARVTTKPITVTNTGTVPANHTLTLGAASPTALATTVLVKIWTVASAAVCTPGTALPVMADWNWTTVPAQTATAVAAGASIVYCVRTSLTVAQVSPTDGRAMVATLALTSRVGTSSWSASAASATAAQSIIDTVAPSVPSALNASSTSDSQTTLTWTASTDVGGVKDYDVYRGATKVGTTTSTTFTDTGLSVETPYGYSVVAGDLTGNVSAASAALNVTTAAIDTSKWYKLVNPASGLCVSASALASGAALTVAGCTSPETWRFQLSSGNYTVAPLNAPTLRWDTTNNGGGGSPQIATGDGSTTQVWQVQPLGAGAFRYMNNKGGSTSCLATVSAPAAGSQIQLASCAASAQQSFTMTAVP